MTRTGKSPRLAAHLAEPFVELNPEDARRAGLTDGGFAKVMTAHGSCILRVAVSEGQQPGSLFVPIHWSGETASSARVGALVSGHADPFSGQPEAKATPAAIAPAAFALRGFARVRRPIALPRGTWWTRVAVANGIEYRFATNEGPLSWHDHAQHLFGGEARLSEQIDGRNSVYGVVAFIDGEFEACLAVGPPERAPSWPSLAGLIAAGPPAEEGCVTLPVLPDAALLNSSPVVCACFGVTVAAVRDLLAASTASSVAEIGRALGAGTNCRSCLPELKRMLSR